MAMPHTRLDPYERLYARRTGTLRSSAMRDLMAVTARPEVISLAGGLPDTRAFPVDLLHELTEGVVRRAGRARCSTGRPRASTSCATRWPR